MNLWRRMRMYLLKGRLNHLFAYREDCEHQAALCSSDIRRLLKSLEKLETEELLSSASKRAALEL